MTTKLDIEKIKKATEVLPERFVSDMMFNNVEKCYCFFGWVAKQLGHDPKPEYDGSGLWSGQDTYVFLREELVLNKNEDDEDGIPIELLTIADGVIKTGASPAVVRERVLEIIEVMYV